MTAAHDHATVDRDIRSMLAEAARLDPVFIARLPSDTELFGPEIALTSLAGVTLLGAIDTRFGVDVAALDLSLDSLQSIATLTEFVTTHVQSH
ncbi:phosphopantetheine-binding protein [Streptomyces sp. NPDC002588]|uniref:phosphopantetheine-binding protein n=1 Tax=Streptomyces sp. NPDC002588 TaxID=3154419 RepID=UPI0033194395